ncbi:MAG TPA: ATP-binding protein [archaeon]|nr:ATP-binding protein [archaeon]
METEGNSRSFRGWVKSVHAVGLLGWISLLVVLLPLVNLILIKSRNSLNLTTNTLILLIITVAIAVKSPIWLTILAAIENFLFLNYFFTPPFHTLVVSNKDDLIALLVYLTSSISASLIIRKLNIRTAKLEQLSKEGLFLSSLAENIIRGHNSIDQILNNSKMTFGLRGLAVARKELASGNTTFDIIYGSMETITEEISESQIVLNAEYSLLADPAIEELELKTLVTTFGSQILILLERQMFEDSERALSDIRQTDQMRVALLNAVSHDLRGPLASSKAAISSLLNDQVTWSAQDQRELLESADQSLNQLNHLIENLLDMSRLESNSIFLNWRNVGVEDVVSGAVKFLKSPTSSIEISIDSDLPPIIGDPILLERVIGNLLENSIRFSPKDRPVTVAAFKTEGRIEIRIIDHGPGISVKNQSKVFIPFQRLGDRDNTTGVGLGLAIVKGFTELMHGRVSMEETYLGGLTVVLSFPIADESPHHDGGGL